MTFLKKMQQIFPIHYKNIKGDFLDMLVWNERSKFTSIKNKRVAIVF